MEVIVLAGGFAKRMWPLTIDKPKHLLQIVDKPMLEYVLEKINGVPNVNNVYISTNAKFEDNFKEFIKNYKTNLNLKLIIEPTLSEEKKLGSIGALGYLIQKVEITDDTIIIGGDNLFDFKIKKILNFFQEKNSSVIVVYDVKDLKKAKLYGIVSMDNNCKITGFLEKPKNPPSTLAATACYILKANDVKNIIKYLEEDNPRDAMGNFIRWLINKTEVFGFVHIGIWFDIGSIESYNEACEYFASCKTITSSDR